MAVKKQKETPMFTKGVPETLRRHFKSWCDLRGISMQDKINSLISETLKIEEIKTERRLPKFVGLDCIIMVRVPTKLRREFKAWCGLRKTNMREKIISLLRETVKDTNYE